MPGLYTSISAKLHYFCYIRANWQLRCNLVCRAEAAKQIPCFNSKALQLRPHTAPFENSPHMGLAEQMTRYPYVDASKQSNGEYKQRCNSVFSPLQREVILSVPLESMLQAGSCSRKLPVYNSRCNNRTLRIQSLRSAQSALLFTHVAP